MENKKKTQPVQRKPDEKLIFGIESHIKITDPETGRVLVNKR